MIAVSFKFINNKHINEKYVFIDHILPDKLK